MGKGRCPYDVQSSWLVSASLIDHLPQLLRQREGISLSADSDQRFRRWITASAARLTAMALAGRQAQTMGLFGRCPG